MKKNIRQDLQDAYPDAVIRILEAVSDVADKRKIKVFMVGGMVRDLLLDNPSIDLDITLEGVSGIEFAKDIAGILNAELKTYPQFNTASVKIEEGLKMDIATCRKEVYSEPGALPDVEVSGIKDDLGRRDFTINAIAISLSSKTFGDILDYYRGCHDLEARLVKIIHNGSFEDDPTRILRALRFAARLSFDFDINTKDLMIKAISQGRLNDVSKDRVRQELKLMLSEEDCSSQIRMFDEYVGLDFIYPRLKANVALYKLFDEARDYLLRFMKEPGCKESPESIAWIVNFIILTDTLKQNEVESVLEVFNFSGKIREKIIKYKQFNAQICKLMNETDRLKPSQIYGILNPLCLEAAFVIMSKTDKSSVKDKIWAFLTKDRLINIEITGDDLKNMGIEAGPEFNVILARLLYAKIDGDIKSKEDELEFIKKLI